MAEARLNQEQRKRAAVEAGMVVLGWSYDDAFWRHWLRVRRTQSGFSKPSPRLSGQVGLASLAGTAAGVMATTSVVAEIGICLVGLSTAALALAAWRLLPRPGHRARPDAAPPEVRITSTGLLYGDTSWLWRSDRETLSYAGIGHGTPPYLCFKFRRERFVGRFDYEVEVPLPPAVAEQAEELTRQILRYKVAHSDHDLM